MRFCPISHIQATAIPQNHPQQHRFRRNATVACLNYNPRKNLSHKATRDGYCSAFLR